MQAIVLEDGGVFLREVEQPSCDTGMAVVRVHAAALNHRDVFICDGKYPGIATPCILGADCSGTVVECEDRSWIGKSVVVNPGTQWGNHEDYHSSEYEILGMPVDGTFAEFLHIPISSLIEKPQHLSFEEAAALPLAGLTAWHALFSKAKLQTGERVLITGAGGGVSSIALSLALSAGCEVFTTSSKPEQRQYWVQRGVRDAYDYRDETWIQHLRDLGGVQVVLDSSGGNQLNDILGLLQRGGRLAVYGMTNGNPKPFDVFKLFWKQITVYGTKMGSDKDFKDMIEFVSRHEIRPQVDSVMAMADFEQAFQRMRDSRQTGKIVLQVHK